MAASLPELAPIAERPEAAEDEAPALFSSGAMCLIDGRYVVRGEIVNTGGSAGTARRLVVTFKKGDDVLATRSYPLALGSIAAGERLSFSQTLDNSPAGATDIVPSVE